MNIVSNFITSLIAAIALAAPISFAIGLITQGALNQEQLIGIGILITIAVLPKALNA